MLYPGKPTPCTAFCEESWALFILYSLSWQKSMKKNQYLFFLEVNDSDFVFIQSLISAMGKAIGQSMSLTDINKFFVQLLM